MTSPTPKTDERTTPMSYFTANLTRVEEDIRDERARQDAKWGEQNHRPPIWVTILTEEVGELSQAALADMFGGEGHSSHHVGMREEAIQVAAVAVAFVEYLDRQADLKAAAAREAESR
jgi:NTP pyrophosphatase (non-canonical NTP hydrolase)